MIAGKGSAGLAVSGERLLGVDQLTGLFQSQFDEHVTFFRFEHAVSYSNRKNARNSQFALVKPLQTAKGPRFREGL